MKQARLSNTPTASGSLLPSAPSRSSSSNMPAPPSTAQAGRVAYPHSQPPPGTASAHAMMPYPATPQHPQAPHAPQGLYGTTQSYGGGRSTAPYALSQAPAAPYHAGGVPGAVPVQPPAHLSGSYVPGPYVDDGTIAWQRDGHGNLRHPAMLADFKPVSSHGPQPVPPNHPHPQAQHPPAQQRNPWGPHR
ncbi:hypothetical protein K474DRAFT_1262090 [Panus rudis PR-1116 ss-1]|nr:hypothetical protein K474DRAFT_1262090 [Panus rudis PR-1116 ss-1]